MRRIDGSGTSSRKTKTHSKPVGTLNSCGGMRLMSGRDPAFSPGTKFRSVVWRSVQFSPLKPQSPRERREADVSGMLARARGHAGLCSSGMVT